MDTKGQRARERRKRLGVCLRCPNKTEANSVHCLACIKKQRSNHATRRTKRRRQIINHYGGQCRTCGEKHYEFLTIEHKNGGGVKHRKSIGPASLVLWVIEEGYPDEIEILCWNCNCSKNKSKTYSDSRNAINRRRFVDRTRQEVFAAYGGSCQCCGINDLKLLTIDHINGGGRQHRLAVGTYSTTRFYRWLITNDFPPEYRALCFNCNCAIGVYGYCPHQHHGL